MQMEWPLLISSIRIGKDENIRIVGRSAFQQDFDRIIFCSAFRRLQDKTQVFPLPESDYVRTRLTHSLEASCVGRSLGTATSNLLKEQHRLPDTIAPTDFGAICSAACLAHDIGNPPFGHSGEHALQYWFTQGMGQTVLKSLRTENERWDFEYFEGNAQGFRILTRLQKPSYTGGLQLTATTLAAFSKYPRGSFDMQKAKEDGHPVAHNKSNEKFGYFQSESEYFKEVAQAIGLKPIPTINSAWARHPLAFLVEAADDICYLLLDFEDGFRLGIIEFEEICEHYRLLLVEEPEKAEAASVLTGSADEKEKVSLLRSLAINSLIRQVSEVFVSKEADLLSGTHNEELTKSVISHETIKKIRTESLRVYKHKYNLEVEAAGFEVISGLLDAFVPAVIGIAGVSPSSKSKSYAELLKASFWNSLEKDKELSNYQKLLKITDYVSGMTDSFAVNLYRKIKGIALPSLE